MSEMTTLATQTFEEETSRLGRASEFIMEVASKLAPGRALTHSEEKALFSHALQLRFVDVRQESGETRREIETPSACYLGLVDGVNYMQYYIKPTVENIRQVIKVIEGRGVQFAKPDQKAAFASMRDQIFSDNEATQQKVIDSIASVRLFDARAKHVAPGEALPLSIDFKFKPTDDGKSRATLKIAAVKGMPTNTNQILTDTIDEIMSRVGQVNLGKIYRRFFSLEWLPPDIVHYFIDDDARILQASLEKQKQIWVVLARYFAVKLDVRFDEIVTPDGQTTHSVTQEAEVAVNPNVIDSNLVKVRSSVSALHEAIGKSFSRQAKVEKGVTGIHNAVNTSFNNEPGGMAYDASVLDAATLALGTPQAKMAEVLSGAYKNKGDIRQILSDMHEQVEQVTARLGMEAHNQVVITPRSTGHLVRKDFTMDEVRSEIDEILVGKKKAPTKGEIVRKPTWGDVLEHLKTGKDMVMKLLRGEGR